MEEVKNEVLEEVQIEDEIQNTVNEDGLDILVEEGSVENEYKND